MRFAPDARRSTNIEDRRGWRGIWDRTSARYEHAKEVEATTEMFEREHAARRREAKRKSYINAMRLREGRSPLSQVGTRTSSARFEPIPKLPPTTGN